MDSTNTNARMQEMADQIQKLQNQLNDLSGQYFRNNFTSSQTFNKDVSFTNRLRVPVFNSAPTVGEIGDIVCVGTGLYICTSTSPLTFTLVGSQT